MISGLCSFKYKFVSLQGLVDARGTRGAAICCASNVCCALVVVWAGVQAALHSPTLLYNSMETFFLSHAYLVEHCNAPVRRSLMDTIDWSYRMIGIRGPRGVRSLAYLALDEIATKLKSSKSRICKARCVSVTRGVLFYSVFLQRCLVAPHPEH